MEDLASIHPVMVHQKKSLGDMHILLPGKGMTPMSQPLYARAVR